jgi:hypothetical protein
MSWRWKVVRIRASSSWRLLFASEGTELTYTYLRLHDEETRRSHEQGWNGALDRLQQHFPNTAKRSCS